MISEIETSKSVSAYSMPPACMKNAPLCTVIIATAIVTAVTNPKNRVAMPTNNASPPKNSPHPASVAQKMPGVR